MRSKRTPSKAKVSRSAGRVCLPDQNDIKAKLETFRRFAERLKPDARFGYPHLLHHLIIAGELPKEIAHDAVKSLKYAMGILNAAVGHEMARSAARHAFALVPPEPPLYDRPQYSCFHCGKAFEAAQYQKYCCEACRVADCKHEPRRCRVCGAEFIPVRMFKFCSPACKAADKAKELDPKKNKKLEQGRLKYARQREILANAKQGNQEAAT